MRMSISFGLRQGIGIDIEFNDNVFHIVDSDENEDGEMALFIGMIVKIPFMYFYFGDFYLEGSD